MRRAIRSNWENDLIGRSRLSIRAVIRDFNQASSYSDLKLKSLAYDSRFGRIDHLELHIAKVWRAVCSNQILACQIKLITLVFVRGEVSVWLTFPDFDWRWVKVNFAWTFARNFHLKSHLGTLDHPISQNKSKVIQTNWIEPCVSISN